MQVVFWKWDDCYLTNVRRLDDDHRKLIDIMNELYSSVLECETLHTENKLTHQVLQELIAYGDEHFKAEEELMRQYDYPGYPEHKEAHEQFRIRIAELVRQYQQGEVALSFPVFVFVKEWIEEHVLKMDHLYGPYLNDKGVM